MRRAGRRSHYGNGGGVAMHPNDVDTYAYLLLGVSGKFSRKKYPLEGSVIVGSHAACQIVLVVDDISLRHVALRTTKHGVVAVGLGRGRSVFINGRQVGLGILLPGDELRLAAHRFLLCPRVGPLVHIEFPDKKSGTNRYR
jgi:hypothetical protein